MQKLLSIVVPVYKVEPYIDKCLSSLILEDASLMERLEVIIVNDGTPDRSAEMSRAYVERFPGVFRQIDKENGGHGSAWNVGLREATGKYLRFLDSDDWLENVDRLLTDLQSCDADLVFNPFKRIYGYENREETVETGIPAGDSGIDPACWGTSNYSLHSVNFWSATYKTAILRPLQPLFAEGVMYDDYILTWAPLVHGRTCRALDYVVYNYLIGRPGQSMSAALQRKGALSYAVCFRQYEQVRSRIGTDAIPPDLLGIIDKAIADYAKFVFPYMTFLPYRDAKERMGYLWTHYVKDLPSKTPMQQRYAWLPFPVFYRVEQLRRKLLKV